MTERRLRYPIKRPCFLCGGYDNLRVIDCGSRYDGRLLCSNCFREAIEFYIEFEMSRDDELSGNEDAEA